MLLLTSRRVGETPALPPPPPCPWADSHRLHKVERKRDAINHQLTFSLLVASTRTQCNFLLRVCGFWSSGHGGFGRLRGSLCKREAKSEACDRGVSVSRGQVWRCEISRHHFSKSGWKWETFLALWFTSSCFNRLAHISGIIRKKDNNTWLWVWLPLWHNKRPVIRMPCSLKSGPTGESLRTDCSYFGGAKLSAASAHWRLTRCKRCRKQSGLWLKERREMKGKRAVGERSLACPLGVPVGVQERDT